MTKIIIKCSNCNKKTKKHSLIRFKKELLCPKCLILKTVRIPIFTRKKQLKASKAVSEAYKREVKP